MSLVRINRYSQPQVGTFLDSPFRLFDEGLSRFFENGLEASRGWMPPVDITENKETLVFTTELPGFDKNDINVSVEDGVLTISGERSREKTDEEYHRVERSYGRFERSFTLPTNVDSNQISANLKNGVLSLTLPKREEAKPKQITVSTS